MERLFVKSNALIGKVDVNFVRNTLVDIDFNCRLNGLIGARGTGKTTRMLQELKLLQQKGHKVLYVTMDDFYFAQKTPSYLATEFAASGGEYLYFDEVHKHPNWSVFIKNIYDFEDRLKVVFSGSSIIQMSQQQADLSRRALMYTMPGLSYREFLYLKYKIAFPIYELNDLVEGHLKIAAEIMAILPPLQYFKEYLRFGFYPFFLEKNRDYQLSLTQIIKYVLEVDFNTIVGYQGGQYYKLLDILLTIAQKPPFDFNATKVAQSVGINRNTLVNYLHYLHKADLIRHVNYPQTSLSNLTKPDKMLLSNPNQYYSLVGDDANLGSVRESFFASQLGFKHDVFLHPDTDFAVGCHIFETGGRNKRRNKKQQKIDGLIIVKDDIEIGAENMIPLYLFGFLY